MKFPTDDPWLVFVLCGGFMCSDQIEFLFSMRLTVNIQNKSSYTNLDFVLLENSESGNTGSTWGSCVLQKGTLSSMELPIWNLHLTPSPLQPGQQNEKCSVKGPPTSKRSPILQHGSSLFWLRTQTTRQTGLSPQVRHDHEPYLMLGRGHGFSVPPFPLLGDGAITYLEDCCSF